MNPSKPGRPTKLQEGTVAVILSAIESGNTRGAAAEAAGVSTTTLQNWIARARAGDPDFLELLEGLKKAEAKAESAAVGAIRSAFEKGTWQAAAWWLERRRYARWRKREEMKVEHTHNVTPSSEAQERREQICAELARRGESLTSEQLRLAAAWNARQSEIGGTPQ